MTLTLANGLRYYEASEDRHIPGQADTGRLGEFTNKSMNNQLVQNRGMFK